MEHLSHQKKELLLQTIPMIIHLSILQYGKLRAILLIMLQYIKVQNIREKLPN